MNAARLIQNGHAMYSRVLDTSRSNLATARSRLLTTLMIVHKTLPLLLLLLVSYTLAQQPPSVPKQQLPPKVFAKPYKDQNLCAFLKPSGGSTPYSFWTCGVPFKQPYCGAQTELEYQCCPGFSRNSELLNGACGESESTWKSLGKHLEDYGVPKFSNLIKSQAKMPELFNESSKSVYTVFVPHSDSAVKQGDFDITRTSGTPHPVKMFIAKNRFYAREMKNGATIETEFNKHKLKVTTYSNGLVFIDCRALTNPDHETRNGVVHYISGPITPHVGGGFQRKTVLQTLQNDPDTNSFYSDLPSDIRSMLDQENTANWYTVFAPSNSAWNEAKSRAGGNVAQLAKNHILDRMICAQAITRKATSLGPTMAQEYLGVNCGNDQSRSVLDACGNEASITKDDLVAGNGVVHVLSKALVPSNVMSTKDAIDCASTGESKISISKFMSALSRCDLQMDSSKSYIILAPTNAAFDWLSSEQKYQQKWDSLPDSCDGVRYHVLETDDPLGSSQPTIINQKHMKTTSTGNPTVVPYVVQYRYGPRLFFNHARAVKNKPRAFKQGFIYYVDRVIVPPKETIMEILSKRTDVSDTYNKLKSSGYDSTLSSMGPNVLFLAPQNHGWKTRDEKKYGSSELSRLFKLMTVKMNLWTEDIGYFQRETSSDVEAVFNDGGKPMQLNIIRELNGNTYIGYAGLPFELWAMVIEGNLQGSDGMVWVVDWPLRFKP